MASIQFKDLHKKLPKGVSNLGEIARGRGRGGQALALDRRMFQGELTKKGKKAFHSLKSISPSLRTEAALAASEREWQATKDAAKHVKPRSAKVPTKAPNINLTNPPSKLKAFAKGAGKFGAGMAAWMAADAAPDIIHNQLETPLKDRHTPETPLVPIPTTQGIKSAGKLALAKTIGKIGLHGLAKATGVGNVGIGAYETYKVGKEIEKTTRTRKELDPHIRTAEKAGYKVTRTPNWKVIGSLGFMGPNIQVEKTGRSRYDPAKIRRRGKFTGRTK